MGAQFTFYDYCVGDRNFIREWLDQHPAADAHFTERINKLAASPPGSPMWRRPRIAPLHVDCDGLFELRVEVGNVQYRLIGDYGPGARTFTLVAGAVEQGGQFNPLAVCDQAQTRMAEVIANPSAYRREHEF